MVVLIFDRSKLIPERLISLISEAKKGAIFYKADTYEKATGLLDELTPQAVLLDFNFPGNSVIELLRMIRKSNEKTVVIVLFTVADDHKLKLYKEHGADFLFDKYHEFEKIPSVIATIPAI
ncbi:MAG: response regulator [Chitinophagaceae bacterium]